MKLVALVVVLAGCAKPSGGAPSAGLVPVEPELPLLAAVGPSPRVYVRLSLAHPVVRPLLDEIAVTFRELRGARTLGSCGIVLTDLDEVRLAIGEPLRIAAEIDGAITLREVECVFGESGVRRLADEGVIVRDRPGGIAIERAADHHHADAARPIGRELGARCVAASCAVARLATPERPLWLALALDETLRAQLSGADLGDGAARVAAAFARLAATWPALHSFTVREERGTLAVEVGGELDLRVARQLRDQLVESYRLPSSSMVPTLRQGDRVLVARGPLRRALVPGDVVAYRRDGAAFVKRYLAGPGHKITEDERGLAIDGAALATEVVDAAFGFRDRDGHAERDVAGEVLREHLGARSYLTLRTGPPVQPGTWVVPEGERFLVGDNRNNSSDSRDGAAITDAAITGMVVATWYATRADGLPDWNRIGLPVE